MSLKQLCPNPLTLSFTLVLLAGCNSRSSSDSGSPDTGGKSDTAGSTEVGADGSADAGGRAPGTIVLDGTLPGATAVDVAFENNEADSTRCGGPAGFYLATSGASIPCGPLWLSMALKKPYLQFKISRREVGLYTLVEEDDCTRTTTDRVFTATFDSEMPDSSLDGTAGTLTITSIGERSVAGTFNVTFSDGSMVTRGTVLGAFTATTCPP